RRVLFRSRFPNSAGELLIIRIAVLSTQLLIKAVLETHALIVFIHVADGTTAQVFKGPVADVDFFKDDASTQSSFTKYGPRHHFLFILVVDISTTNDYVLPSVSTGIAQQVTVFAFGAIFKKS